MLTKIEMQAMEMEPCNGRGYVIMRHKRHLLVALGTTEHLLFHNHQGVTHRNAVVNEVA